MGSNLFERRGDWPDCSEEYSERLKVDILSFYINTEDQNFNSTISNCKKFSVCESDEEICKEPKLATE